MNSPTHDPTPWSLPRPVGLTRVYLSVGSTQDVLRRALMTREPPNNSAVLAYQQTTGYGTNGRAWSTKKGNLAMSILFTDLLITQGTLVLHSIMLALCSLLNKRSEQHHQTGCIAFKWPNDLVWCSHGRTDPRSSKIGGILLDAIPNHHHPATMSGIVGIGLNLAHAPKHTHFPAERLPSAIASDPLELANAIVRQIVPRVREIRSQPNAQLPVRLGLSRFLWQPTIAITIHQIKQQVRGTILGLTSEGALILQTSNGRRQVHHGSIVHPHSSSPDIMGKPL